MHVEIAGIFSGHAYDLNGCTLLERRNSLRGDTPRLERDSDPAFQIVMWDHRCDDSPQVFESHLARILVSF